MATAASGNPRLWQWLAGGLGVLALASGPAGQAKAPVTSLNPAGIILMEEQADRAKPREQCYLYTQVADALTDAAGRQVAAGDDEEAGKTVGRLAEVIAKLQHAAERDAKKLKDAEKILSETARKLKDLSRVASGGQRDQMRAAVVKLDAAHNKVLNLVFLQ
jgi:hypothetical protein